MKKIFGDPVKFPQKPIKLLKPWVFISMFAIVGVLVLVLTRAATPFAVLEPEQGTKSSNISLVNDSTASAGSAVRFGQGATQANNALFHRIAIDSLATFPNPGQTAGRQSFVIIQPWDTADVQALKAANPNVKVLMYKNLGFMSSVIDSSGKVSSGVTYKEADTAHPDWFMKNTSGQRFTSNWFSWLWAADVGNLGYQDQWASNVVSELKDSSFDGVFLDDVNTTFRHHYSTANIAGYTDSGYQAAVRSALANIGADVQVAGKITIANIGSPNEFPSVWGDWIQFISGALDEQFVKFGDNNASLDTYSWDWGAGGWRTRLGFLEEAERQGKYFLGNTHSTPNDNRAARYGLSTLLLGANGRSSFQHGGNYTDETWFPEYDIANRLGAASGAHTKLSNGIYRREFANGIVLVNPTQSSQTASLGGTYSGSGLSNVTSVNMEAKSGLILEKN